MLRISTGLCESADTPSATARAADRGRRQPATVSARAWEVEVEIVVFAMVVLLLLVQSVNGGRRG